MKHQICVLLLLCFAQTAAADDCESRFADLRWTLTEEDSVWKLDADYAASVLVGTTCDAAFVISWFSCADLSLKGDWSGDLEIAGSPGEEYWSNQ